MSHKPKKPKKNRPPIEVVIPARFTVSPAMLDGLRHMGRLRRLDLRRVPGPFARPLERLFELASQRTVLGGRDRHLPALAALVFTAHRRIGEWVADTDIKHTVASFGYLAEICQKEGLATEETKAVLSALIVHDCAYPKTDGFDAFTSADVRLVHMLEGEKEFVAFAKHINREFPGFYSGQTIGVVRAIVRQHDNPSILSNGRSLQFDYGVAAAKLVWAHREADRLWMLDRAGFALDLLRRLLEPNPWYKPQDYLNHVVLKHLEEADLYDDNEACRPYRGIRSLYRTQAGFNLFQRLVRARFRDYGLPLERSEPPRDSAKTDRLRYSSSPSSSSSSSSSS